MVLLFCWWFCCVVLCGVIISVVVLRSDFLFLSSGEREREGAAAALIYIMNLTYLISIHQTYTFLNYKRIRSNGAEDQLK